MNVAVASWLGAGFGAEWFVMVDVHQSQQNHCKGCTITDSNDNSRNLSWNGGYIAGGFFAIFTGAYLGFSWWINSIRILVAASSSIPFFDALGFLHGDTINGQMLIG